MSNAQGLRPGQTGSKHINKFLPTTGDAPVNAVAAVGTLTIAEPVTENDTITIGSRTYTFKAGATAASGEIGLGAGEAATKLAIVAAINGTDNFNSINSLVSASAFSGDVCTLTARTKGASGNSIVTTETFTHASNVFNDDTLGATTAGVDGTAGYGGEQILTDSYLYIALSENTISGNNWRRISLGSAY